MAVLAQTGGSLNGTAVFWATIRMLAAKNRKNNTLHQDALNALTALGINRQAAGQAIEKVLATNSNIPVEDLVKSVLRTL